MKEYDLTKPFLDEEDVPSGKTLAQVLTKVIFNTVDTKAPMKLFEMALELKLKGKLKLDTPDKDMLVAFITSHEGMYNILKGQLLQILK